MANLESTDHEKVDKWYKRNRLIVTLMPVIFFMISIFAVQADHKPEVTFHPGAVHPGYEATPPTYYVEASPHKKWADYWHGHEFLVILGFIIAAGGTFVYISYVNDKGLEGNWKPIAIAWVGGALLVFLGYVLKHGGMEYFTTLSVEDYERYKNTLDTLFPIKK